MRGSLFGISMEHRVIQYSRDGELIKIWDSMTLASVCTGDSLYIINRQCRGLPIKKKDSFIWRFYTPGYLTFIP